MNCIIVEDDELAVAALKKCIERHGGLEVQAVFSDGREAIKHINENSCELLFLDVEIQGVNGMELIRSLSRIPRVIIISSKSDYAAEAYDYDVADYIVKPINYDRFCRAINKLDKIEENYADDGVDYFYLKNNGKLSQIYYKDILYVEALSDYVTIHTLSGKKYTVLSTMKAIESKLPEKDFTRVHRSFILRLDKITEIEDNQARLNGQMFPISRNSYEDLLKKVHLF